MSNKTTSGKFLSKFFEKLTYADFKTDRVLAAFYIAYEKQVEKDTESKIDPTPLFQFFTEYLIRNKELNEKQKADEIATLYDSIKESIFNPPVVEADIDPRIARKMEKPIDSAIVVQKKTVNIIEKNNTRTLFKLNKKHAMSIIAEFIKQSFIITYEDPDLDMTQEDEDFRDNSTTTITEEIIANCGSLPKPIKDVQFGRRNDLIEIWHNCENKCIKFIEADALANLLKKAYLLDSASIIPGTTKTISTITNKEMEEFGTPQETLVAVFPMQQYQTKITLVQSNSLTEAMTRAKQKIKCVLVNSGNQMVNGSNLDQGIESAEMYLYYSSSYNLSLNRVVHGYPLENTHIVYSPNVLVFKNHQLPKYPMLSSVDGQKISVLNSAPKFRPETNLLNQDKYNLDQRLYLPSTQYKNPNDVSTQLNGIFTTALFFGHDTIILDERGIRDYYHPAYHLAQIMAASINSVKGKFREIVVAIDDVALFNIFSKSFSS